ncbi:hypothetical protein [Pseudomonas sp. 65/3-MNA-CIBAN-0223]|uniref:hypothetical protein n=1 Tax=Pseudomonas sp. 65/3-MNA-CIBAN-0223 TaxID=3140476 RepID=UPI003319D3EA
MHKLLALFLVFSAGWTFSLYIAAIFKLGLENVLVIAPFVIGLMQIAFSHLTKLDLKNALKNKNFTRKVLKFDKNSCVPTWSWISFCVISSVFFEHRKNPFFPGRPSCQYDNTVKRAFIVERRHDRNSQQFFERHNGICQR